MRPFASVISVLALVSSSGVPARAEATPPTPSLEDQLRILQLPENQAPSNVTAEKLYAVQTRYSPLASRGELGLGVARNLTVDSFLSSGEISGKYRFHFNDRWSLGISGSYTFNSLSGAGQRLLELNQLLPDVSYVKGRSDLTAGFNVFYGKFRLSLDQVFYFDQYVELGAGRVWLDRGDSTAAVVDAGFAFWAGRSASVRFGLRNYLFQEQRRLSSGLTDHLLAHLDIGMMLGGGGVR